MADLEEMGLLSQPHPSAGRVPTDKAFRYYVDSILNVRDLTQKQRERIKRSYHPSKANITDTLKETGKDYTYQPSHASCWYPAQSPSLVKTAAELTVCGH